MNEGQTPQVHLAESPGTQLGSHLPAVGPPRTEKSIPQPFLARFLAASMNLDIAAPATVAIALILVCYSSERTT